MNIYSLVLLALYLSLYVALSDSAPASAISRARSLSLSPRLF
jgi:hypothetical protein